MAKKTIYHPAYRELVAGLRAEREGLGKSQKELARELGWSQQRLSAVEAGARRLDVVEFVQLIDALGRCPAEVIRSISDSLRNGG